MVLVLVQQVELFPKALLLQVVQWRLTEILMFFFALEKYFCAEENIAKKNVQL